MPWQTTAGNTILVFTEEGLKGEIETTLPIEKIAVSDQGIVTAVLRNESSPEIISYDAVGNILVEQQASHGLNGIPGRNRNVGRWKYAGSRVPVYRRGIR